MGIRARVISTSDSVTASLFPATLLPACTVRSPNIMYPALHTARLQEFLEHLKYRVKRATATSRPRLSQKLAKQFFHPLLGTRKHLRKLWHSLCTCIVLSWSDWVVPHISAFSFVFPKKQIS